MDKVISFNKGIRRQPSIGDDGELSELVNLIPKNGELVNVRPMIKAMEGITLSRYEILIATHKVQGGVNYITKGTLVIGTSALNYYYYDETSSAWLKGDIAEVEGDINIQVIGNVLAVATPNGIKYAIWKDGAYIWLGALPKLDARPYLQSERLSIYELNEMFETDIGATTSRVLSGSEGVMNATLMESLKNNPNSGSIKLYGETREKVYERVFAVINQYRNVLREKGYFCSPFYVRFAYRLYDGTHVKPTQPILMVPNTWGKPIVDVIIGDDGIATFEPIFLASKLCADIKSNQDAELWNEIITHIDVFVSEEIEDYTDSSECLEQIETAPYWVYGESVDEKGNPTFIWVKSGDVPQMMDGNVWRNFDYIKTDDGSGYIKNSVSYNADTTYRFQKDDTYEERYLAIENSSGSVVILNMNTKRNSPIEVCDVSAESLGLSGNYDIYDLHEIQETFKELRLRFKSAANGYIVRGPHSAEQFSPSHFHIKLSRVGEETYDELLRSASNYRLISNYELSTEIYDGIDGEIPLAEGGLNNHSTQRGLTVSNISNMEIATSKAFQYNSRLNLVADQVIYKACDSLGTQNPCKGKDSWTAIKGYVTIFENGQNAYVEIETSNIDARDLYYFAYHSASAIRLTLYDDTSYQDEGVYYKHDIQLQRHDTLDIAYAFNDFYPLAVETTQCDEMVIPSPSHITYGNVLYATNASQPFSVSDDNIVTIPSQVIAISSAAKALSQGQFGQFPLYAFCDDGIWALEIASDGTFSAKQPISRDVCNNPAAITQIDDAVIFTSSQGLKMIQGSEVVLLSEQMNGHNVAEDAFFPSGILPGEFQSLVIPEAMDFRDMLKTCTIAYDYPEGLLYIFPRTGVKWYAYSLANREYTTIKGIGNPTNIVAGYPTPLVQVEGTIYTFGGEAENNTIRNGLLLTRPIDMGEPFAMKKLHDMRMHYTKHHSDTKCQMVVYVSNDSRNWFVLPSLRKRSFKYYRIAIVTNMTDADRLSGLIMRYDLERVNKIR